MNCKKCGTKLPGYAKYCLNCGEKVNLDKAAAGEVDESVGIEEQPWEEYEDMWTWLFSKLQGHPAIFMLIVKAVSIIKILFGIPTTALSLYILSERKPNGVMSGSFFLACGITTTIIGISTLFLKKSKLNMEKYREKRQGHRKISALIMIANVMCVAAVGVILYLQIFYW